MSMTSFFVHVTFSFECALASVLYLLFISLRLFTPTIEFATIAKATGIGFLIMGFTGFFVKLIHIPINNIIVGGV